jgi:hypothetical protein
MYARSKTTGLKIVGTSETILATAITIDDSFEKRPNGDISYDHEGSTDIAWDTQRTLTDRAGGVLFVDIDGNDIPESDIELLDTDPTP